MPESPNQLGKGKTIFWDLDGTVVLDGMHERASMLRYGMNDLLGELRAGGFKHVITTNATKDYAEQALTRTGVRDHFANLYGRETTTPEFGTFGKSYRSVAEQEGYGEEQDIRDHVLIIGDSKGDHPQDANPVVIRLGQRMGQLDALVFREIIVALLEKGEGSFHKGFDSLYTQAQHTDRDRVVDIGNGIKFHMDRETYGGDGSHYRNEAGISVSEDTLVPVIFGIEAPDYNNKPPVEK